MFLETSILRLSVKEFYPPPRHHRAIADAPPGLFQLTLTRQQFSFSFEKTKIPEGVKRAMRSGYTQSLFKTAGREELAIYFTSRRLSTRLRLRLTRQPPLRGGRRSPNSFSPGFAFGSPASRRCAAGAARRTRFSKKLFPRVLCSLGITFLAFFF